MSITSKKSGFALDDSMAERLYLLGAGLVLAFTALAKISVLIWPAPNYVMQLMSFNPIVFFLSAQTLLWFVVLLELAVCSVVFRNTSRTTKHYALALLGSLFVSYQLGLLLGNFPKPCLCLGGSLEWLGISSEATRIIAFLLLLYIWLPSSAVLAHWLWKRKQSGKLVDRSKISASVLLLTGGLGFAIPAGQTAETFKLEGKLNITAFDYEESDKVLGSRNVFFSIAIQEKGQWQMHYREPSDTAVFVFGSDGKDIYGIWYALVLHQPPSREVLRLPPGSEARREAMKNLPVEQRFQSPDETEGSMGFITPGVYPYDLFWRSVPRVIWFALASDHYLNTATNVSRMPAFWIGGIREQPFAFTFENKIETFPQWPRLPKEATFRTLGQDSVPENPVTMPEIDYPIEPGSQAMLEEELDILKYIEAGHLGMEYACLIQTNLGGAVLPLKFESRIYWPGCADSYFKTNELATLLVGQVTNIVWQKDAPPLGKPPIRSKRIKIDDYRFRDSGGKRNYLIHATTNNVWPAMDDPHVQLYYEERKMKEREAEWNSLGRWAGLLIILAVIAIPVWGWWKEKRKARQ